MILFGGGVYFNNDNIGNVFDNSFVYNNTNVFRRYPYGRRISCKTS